LLKSDNDNFGFKLVKLDPISAKKIVGHQIADVKEAAHKIVVPVKRAIESGL